MKRVILAFAVALAGWGGAGSAALPALASSLCVGSGSGCYPTIQAALNAARDGDVIHIGAGTFAGGIVINVSVQIIGAGAQSTIIKGGGPVVIIGQAQAPTEPTVSLTGVTITGGRNTSVPAPVATLGGGIRVPPGANGPGATVTITDSVITDNAAIPTASTPAPQACPTCQLAFAQGGGILNRGVMTLTNTVVSHNRVGDMEGMPAFASDARGAGIFTGFGDSLTLNSSVVSGNHALVTAPNGRSVDAGGIWVGRNGTLTVNDSQVDDNTADVSTSVATAGPNAAETGASSGGIHVIPGATAMIRGTSITGNEVSETNNGGDAIAFSGGIDNDGSLVLRDSTVSNNRVNATTTFTGSPAGSAFVDSGALEIEGAATISNTKFLGNTVSAISAAGSAFANPGGIGAIPSQPVTISDSLISANSAFAASNTGQANAQGGGLLVFGVVTLRDTTVSQNVASASGSSGVAQGGGIWNGPPFPGLTGTSTLTLIDSLVTGNSLIASPGIPRQGGGLFNAPGETVTLTGTVISGNAPDNCYPPNTIAGCSG